MTGGARTASAAAATIVAWALVMLAVTRGPPPWEGMDDCALARWTYDFFGGSERFGPPPDFFATGFHVLAQAPGEIVVAFPDANGPRPTEHRIVAHRHTGGVARVQRMDAPAASQADPLRWEACRSAF